MKICPICRCCYEDTDTRCSQADRSILVPSRPGSRVIDDKYRLDRLLGRGGMGAVYEALHVELERPTAIKLLLPDLISDEQALERFKREARAAARLNHPNVAGTYDFGTLPGGESYIVMELVKGETLSERLTAAGALPFGEAALIARQVADGIESAHEGGIVHRDLKPANIIISRDHRGTALVKVLDFGIAQLKETSTTGGLASITTAGSIMGTPRYMSPEQCSDHKVDARSDIYSLGVILYEMLAGRPPFDAPSAMALALKQIQEQPPPLSEARPGAPDALERLVMWALAKDPADRPQTAAEFSRALLTAEEAVAPAALPLSPSPPQPDAGSLGGDRSFRPEGEESTPAGAPSLHSASSDRPREDAPSDGGRGYVPAGTKTPAKGSADVEPSHIVAAGRVGDLPSTPGQAARAAAPPTLFNDDSTRIVPRPKRGRTRLLVFAAVGVLAISLVGIVIAGRWRNRSQRVASEPNAPSAPVSRPESSRESQAPDGAQRGTGNQAGSPVKAAEKDSTQTPEAERRVLQSALAGWVAATNARDLNRQLAYYAPRLEAFYLARDVPREAVRAEKRNTFSHADSVSISVDDVAVEIGRDGLTATMKFRKQYVIESGGGRRDGEVLQELQWSKTDAGWKITSERDLQVLR
jgi:serine/threonine protein kinase/ketosteroid isomerase-like protein